MKETDLVVAELVPAPEVGNIDLRLEVVEVDAVVNDRDLAAVAMQI